jgi:protein-disulfide isomerase
MPNKKSKNRKHEKSRASTARAAKSSVSRKYMQKMRAACGGIKNREQSKHHSMIDALREMTNAYRWQYVLLGMVGVVLLCVSFLLWQQYNSVAQELALFRSAKNVVTYKNHTFVRFDEPHVRGTFLTGQACDASCVSVREDLGGRIARYAPTIEIMHTYDVSEATGRAYADAHSVVAVPAIVFEDTITKTQLYQEYQELFAEGDAGYKVFYPYNLVDTLPEYYRMDPRVESPFVVQGAADDGTVHVFMGLDCPLCATQQGVLTLIEREYGEKIRFVYHFARQSDHVLQAQAALFCAAQQGRFGAYRDRLFARHAAWTTTENLSDALTYYANFVGDIDVSAFETCQKKSVTIDSIKNDQKIFDHFGVARVPALIVEGVRHDGVQTYDELKEIVEKILEGTEK